MVELVDKLGGIELSGDFERTRRQRDIMLAIFKKIMSARDAQTISEFVGYAMNNVETNMQPGKIFSLALAILNNKAQT